jgi:hypothetical protein
VSRKWVLSAESNITSAAVLLLARCGRRSRAALRRLAGGRYAQTVRDLQKRGSYTPRRVRERRAYQLAVGGGVAGVVGVVGLVLAVVGVIGATLPILALVVAAVCVFLFRRVIAG